jgi:hypothetical protein
MKEVKLTQGYVALVDNEDYQRVSQFKWYAQKKYRKDGSLLNVYAERKTPRKHGSKKQGVMKMHRFLLRVTDPETRVDHKDHNGLHNWRTNLRKANAAQNAQNCRVSTRNKSGLKGVSKKGSKWRAQIMLPLGFFSNKRDAARAYDKAARKMFGEFACLNCETHRACGR